MGVRLRAALHVAVGAVYPRFRQLARRDLAIWPRSRGSDDWGFLQAGFAGVFLLS